MKIMLIGDKSVGKTLLIRHILNQHYTKPTIGFQLVHTNHLQIYDTSGDREFEPIISRFYDKIKHFVLVYKNINSLHKYESLYNKYSAEWTLLHNSERVDSGKEYADAHDMNFIRSNLLFSENAKQVLTRIQSSKQWRYCWFY